MPPIKDVVLEIRGHLYDIASLEGRADKHRLHGQKLLSLRQRIEAGEEGDVAWWDWFEKQGMGRGRKDCEKLMRIAASEWPEKAMADERGRVRLAVAKSRGERDWLVAANNATGFANGDEVGIGFLKREKRKRVSRSRGLAADTGCKPSKCLGEPSIGNAGGKGGLLHT
jgi:hypothetical protein